MFGLVDKKKLYEEANKVLQEIGIKNVKASDLMGSLDFQERKLVEIAKVMMKKPDILVIDETSTALSHDGRTLMYGLIKRLKRENKSVIFISHDLEEITTVCDTLTVLRDGKLIRTFEKEEFDDDLIRTSMIGRELQGDYYRTDFEATSQEEVALEGKNINYGDKLKNVNISLHKGEIVGIGGLSTCGMHYLGEALFGALELDGGQVITESGKEIKSCHNAVSQKIGYVSKDRDTKSLCLEASIKDNIAIAGMNIFKNNAGMITEKNEKDYVQKQVNDLSIKCSDMNQQVSQLSGGNKQKVVFGKWIGCDSEILILDCPTRGVDIGVKQAMYQLMIKLKKQGKAILMISEELPELLGMSDRVLIMKDGEITKEFNRSKDLSEADVIGYMI
jgi:ribose transport system ATP-binding protein